MNQKSTRVQNLGSFVWSIAEILRGDFKQSEYGKVILPFVVMRRLDCILEAFKPAVLAAEKGLPEGIDDETRDMILFGAAGHNIRVYNTSRFTFASLKGQDPGQLHDNLIDYITRFSPNVRDIFLDKFRFTESTQAAERRRHPLAGVRALLRHRPAPEPGLQHRNGLPVRGSDPPLLGNLERNRRGAFHPARGDPPDRRAAARQRRMRRSPAPASSAQVYDPACGTGGMLALTEEAMTALNPKIRVELFGQELNGESFGICKSDMLVTGHDPEQIAFGNTLTEDAHAGKTFHYMLSNPPYGVDWKKYQDPIKRRSTRLKGFDGRFGAGLPRISDGQLALPAAHDLERCAMIEQGQPHRHRHERLAALHGRGRIGRKRNPPMDAGKRLG